MTAVEQLCLDATHLLLHATRCLAQRTPARLELHEAAQDAAVARGAIAQTALQDAKDLLARWAVVPTLDLKDMSPCAQVG